MQISRKATYALRALVAMSRQSRSWTITELSRAEGIPVKLLEQSLLALRRGGLLASQRGVHGGYTLRSEPSKITVASVIVLLDGPFAPTPCAAEHPVEKCTCPDPRTCPVRKLMTDARQQLAVFFGERTIEDLRRLAPGGDALAFEI